MLSNMPIGKKRKQDLRGGIQYHVQQWRVARNYPPLLLARLQRICVS